MLLHLIAFHLTPLDQNTPSDSAIDLTGVEVDVVVIDLSGTVSEHDDEEMKSDKAIDSEVEASDM